MADLDLILMLAVGGGELYLSLQGDAEGKYVVVACLGSNLLTVGIKGDLGTVGIYLYGSHLLCPLGIAAATDVNEGILRPPSLIEIEAVLLYLSVKGDKTLVVHAGLAALISGISGKVKHIPQMCRPHEGTLVKEVKHKLVILALIFLGLVSSVRMRGMEIWHTLAAILGVSETAVGITVVEVVYPHVVKPHKGSVPAEIEIPAYYVGEVAHTVEGSAHCIAGKSGGTAGIPIVNKVVKHLMVVHHILAVLGRDGNLVGDTPYADRGVVVALNQQLLHLADRVLASVRHMLGNIGDLCPYDHTVLVAEVIEILIVLIVCETNSVGADLADHSHIGIVMLSGNGVTDTLPVLVTAYAAKGIGLAVKEEALVCINAEGAATKGTGHLIDRLTALKQYGVAGIEIGILYSVPEVNLFNNDGFVGIAACANDPAVGILQSYMYTATLAVMPGSYPDRGILACNLGTNGKSATAVKV